MRKCLTPFVNHTDNDWYKKKKMWLRLFEQVVAMDSGQLMAISCTLHVTWKHIRQVHVIYGPLLRGIFCCHFTNMPFPSFKRVDQF